MRYVVVAAGVAGLVVFGTTAAGAQTRPFSRVDAIAAANAHASRIALAAADTSSAHALLLGARELPNPQFLAEWTKSAPQLHFTFEVPFDFLRLRGDRIRSAEASRSASQYRFRFETVSSELDADVAYTRALAAAAHADLSRRNVLASDSLRRMTAARRDAGDASDFDVELSAIIVGQQQNTAALDSLELTGTLLTLQTAMGMASDTVRISLSDTLAPPPPNASARQGGTPLTVAAAGAELSAAELLARVERRSTWLAPSVALGFETRDPGGSEPGILPTIGISLPIPLLNKHKSAIMLADAQRDHARAALAQAQIESDAQITRVLREFELARQRVVRGQTLVAGANRVATMSLAAYREGAATLPSVLEAQRNAREVLATYIDDVASAWIALATARVVTITVVPATSK